MAKFVDRSFIEGDNKTVTFRFFPEDNYDTIDRVLRERFNISQDASYEIRVVTPEGEIVVSNLALKNPDLKGTFTIRADRSSPRLVTTENDFLYLNLYHKCESKVGEWVLYHLRQHYARLSQKVLPTAIGDEYAVMNVSMQISTQLRTVANYPKDIYVLDVKIVPTFGVTSSEGPSPAKNSNQWFMSSFDLRVNRSQEDSRDFRLVEYSHSPANEMKGVEVQRTTGWTAGISISNSLTGNIAYDSSCTVHDTIPDFITTYITIPRDGHNVHQWQLQLGHFDDGKEEYESDKNTPRRYSDVTKSAFSIYQKSFSQSWIISPKDIQRLRGTLSLQVAATVIAQYGPDPGSEDDKEIFQYIETQNGAERKLEMCYNSEAPDVHAEKKPKRIHLRQLKNVNMVIDLDNLIIPNMDAINTTIAVSRPVPGVAIS